MQQPLVSNGVEFQFRVGRIGRTLAHVHLYAGTPRHGTHYAEAHGVLVRQEPRPLVRPRTMPLVS